MVLAGGAAVAANVGILGAANGDSIGQLTSSGGIGFADPAAPAVTNTPATSVVAEPAAEVPAAADTQLFRVGDVGTVAVVRTADGITLGDVTPEPGWLWAPSTTPDGHVVVTFAAGNDRLVFSAAVGPDGTVAAHVDQLAVPQATSQTASTPASPPAPASQVTDDDDDDTHEVHHEEHEGGDDDD